MKFRLSLLWCLVALLAVACNTRTSNVPRRDAVAFPDVFEFRTRLADVIQPGMTISEVREFLLSEYPPPSIATEGAPVHTRGPGPNFMRRFIMTWPTVTRDESVMLTVFCDESYHVIRWVVGTLTEGPIVRGAGGGSGGSTK
jgi:hypothetical protein